MKQNLLKEKPRTDCCKQPSSYYITWIPMSFIKAYDTFCLSFCRYFQLLILYVHPTRSFKSARHCEYYLRSLELFTKSLQVKRLKIMLISALNNWQVIKQIQLRMFSEPLLYFNCSVCKNNRLAVSDFADLHWFPKNMFFLI